MISKPCTSPYAIVLPLLLATVLSTAMSRAIGSASVYERELRRRGLEWQLTLEGRRMPAGQMDQGAVDTQTTPRSL